MRTQWLVSSSGYALGLRYEALPTVYRGLRIAPDAEPDIFDALQVLEQAALQELHDARD